jgi:hypothetical protein
MSARLRRSLFSWLFLIFCLLAPHRADSSISQGITVQNWTTFAPPIGMSSSTSSLRKSWAYQAITPHRHSGNHLVIVIDAGIATHV